VTSQTGAAPAPVAAAQSADESARAQPVQPERRPSDVVVLCIAALLVVVTGMWAQSSTDVDKNLFAVMNQLPNAFDGVARAFAFLGSIWFVAIAVAILLLVRWFPAARDAAIGGVGAWLVANGLNDLLGSRSASSLGITVRSGSGPSFPTASVAVATALAMLVAPYVSRPLRRAFLLVVLLVAASAMYLGTGLSSDVLGGLFLGIAFGAGLHALFGAPRGRPTTGQVEHALAELGLEAVTVRPSEVAVARATVMDAELSGEGPARVVVYGRDQRDGEFGARLWQKIMYKAPGVPAFGSRLQQVEHIAYGLVLGEQAGVRLPHLLKTGVGGPDAALLVTSIETGRPLDALGDDLSDDVLASAWTELRRLHDAGVTHGDLGPGHLVLESDGRVGFVDLGFAPIGNSAYWRNRDVATLLVVTSQLVGNDRAITAAVNVMGKQALGDAIPLIQPAALPRAVSRSVPHASKTLKALRSELAKATGAEDVAPVKIRRLSLVNIGMLAGVLLALAIAIPSLSDVNWSSVQNEFAQATWGWAVLALVLYPLVPMSWATALMGCVNADLPFVPTVLTQLACSFLNLITPNGIGGTALQLDYLHHQDVPVASGASAMVLSTGVGGAIQVVLFLGALAVTATTVDLSRNGDSVTLGAIAVVAALVGVVLWVPKVRNKVLPAVRRAASDIWTVLRNPKKGVQLFGGDLAGNLIYPALLGLCLLAFGHSLSFAQLIVVQLGAGMLGGAAPVPGGIGVQEAALTAGLTAMGIPSNPALATVIVFRGITFALPPIFGFFTLHYLRRRGYA
jgi:uncharacterized membrane protein YbhN (UPF0104 family)/membrane-associated phospholipid phosphatase